MKKTFTFLMANNFSDNLLQAVETKTLKGGESAGAKSDVNTR